MLINKKIFITGILSVGMFFSIASVNAADESDIANLEKQLVQKETELLVPELKLDRLQKDRSQYDGASGWFKKKKKKALDAEIASAKNEVSRLHSDVKVIAANVQEMVYEVAYTLEKKGQYKQAIGFYLKIGRQTDKVIYRIATCHKQMKDFHHAISWFLKMNRSDRNLLEVVDCYKLDDKMKDSVYWLFEILEPFADNKAELTALKLIEEYDYQGRKRDYPDFFQRLSNVYLNKATSAYDSNFVQAAKDYKKAVSLLADDMGDDEGVVSQSILRKYQNKYQQAIEILEKQKDAAERNFEDKVRVAKREIDDAREDLRRARRGAERDYEQKLLNAEEMVRRSRKRLETAKADTLTTPEQLDRIRRQLENSRRDLRHIEEHREEIVRSYLAPYKRDVRDAEDSYDELLDNRRDIIAKYVAPYKRKVSAAKQELRNIEAMHEANY